MGRLTLGVAVGGAMAMAACAGPSPGPSSDVAPPDSVAVRKPTAGMTIEPTIEQALAELNSRVLSLPGVVGTGIGECEGVPCLKVFVAEKSAELDAKIPDRVGGHPVEVEETGEFRPR